MMHLALLYSDEAARPTPESPNFDAVIQGYADAGRSFKGEGAFISAEPLQPVATAKSVRVRGGEVITMDGPFAETKERLGGFYLLDCRDRDHAIRLAAMIPAARYGTIELRPVMAVELPT